MISRLLPFALIAGLAGCATAVESQMVMSTPDGAVYIISERIRGALELFDDTNDQERISAVNNSREAYCVRRGLQVWTLAPGQTQVMAEHGAYNQRSARYGISLPQNGVCPQR